MPYFHESHDQVRYILAVDDQPGLRNSQIGAIHMISAHFTLQNRSAVVVLPTGAGKTAVLMLVPYVLRAGRVLVITQSRFVRDQITRDYKSLRTLKQIRALPNELPPPSVFENTRTIQSQEAWEALRAYDVVIATPHTISPGHRAIPAPPPDIFSLVIVDEAHHSPAPTWNTLIEAFPQARCVLFTATPFRRDGKEIKGKYIYTYPIQRAFEDNIYGEMRYLPIVPPAEFTADEALARAAEQVFQEDRAADLSHAIMVRADSRSRANALAEIYRQHAPTLRLEVVHSDKSQRITESIVDRLRRGELDGLICVNMLGEGFDFPNLKIAALHAPHRSLAVTLQFFGRFARVNGDRLGEATFLAVPDEIDNDLAELFRDGEAWGKKIRLIGQERIGQEVLIREFIEDFATNEVDRGEAALEDLSLYSFNLFNHVKIFKVHGNVDLSAIPELRGFTVEKTWVAEPRSTAVILAREEINLKWVMAKALSEVKYRLFVVYYDEPSGLLFINSTYREEAVYRDIAEIFITGHYHQLSLSKINRVLRSIARLELFHVGMRNRATGTVAESYRQIAGGAVHDSIDKGDGALYHRGHLFGRGQGANGVTTIGLSSLSKIWRLEHTKIPVLVEWCQQLARDINNAAPFVTGIALDYLDAGQDITELPAEVVIAANWHDAVYQNPPLVRFVDAVGEIHTISLLDCDVSIDDEAIDAQAITVIVSTERFATKLQFVLVPYPHMRYANDEEPRWRIERSVHTSSCLADFLTHTPLRFHLADGSLLEGAQLFSAPEEDTPYDAEGLMIGIDWVAVGVNTRQEYGACAPPLCSIHDWLRDELIAQPAPIVFYDHRKGECADYLTVEESAEGRLIVKLFHCKGAGGAVSGERVNDLYEVCGQATKSTQWRSKKRLIHHVRDRVRSGSQFCKGTLEQFIELVEPHPRAELALEIYIVQPGVSKRALSARLAALLAASNRGLVAAGCERLRVFCSS